MAGARCALRAAGEIRRGRRDPLRLVDARAFEEGDGDDGDWEESEHAHAHRGCVNLARRRAAICGRDTTVSSGRDAQPRHARRGAAEICRAREGVTLCTAKAAMMSSIVTIATVSAVNFHARFCEIAGRLSRDALEALTRSWLR